MKSPFFLAAVVIVLACSVGCTSPKRTPAPYDPSFLGLRVPDVKLDDITVLGESGSLVLPVATPLPFYPFGLLLAGATGQVELVLLVAQNGEVAAARVSKGGNREFEEACLRAVENWKFFRRDFTKEAAPAGIEVSCRIIFATSAGE